MREGSMITVCEVRSGVSGPCGSGAGHGAIESQIQRFLRGTEEASQEQEANEDATKEWSVRHVRKQPSIGGNGCNGGNKLYRLSWEGSDCEADSCVDRGVSEARIGYEIRNE